MSLHTSILMASVMLSTTADVARFYSVECDVRRECSVRRRVGVGDEAEAHAHIVVRHDDGRGIR